MLNAPTAALREALRSADEDNRRTPSGSRGADLAPRNAGGAAAAPDRCYRVARGRLATAGGERYRLNRMFRWYRRKGYRILPVIAPLPGEELSREDIEGTAAAFGNVIQVHRDGRIEHDLRDVPDSLSSFRHHHRQGSRSSPGEQAGSTFRTRELLNIERTFCHDAVISTVLQLQQCAGTTHSAG